jgi:hypothetical protein
MPRGTTIDDLESRRRQLASVAYAAAGAALVAAIASIILLQPGAGTGPADVHLPDTGSFFAARDPAAHIAGGPIAELQARLGTLLLVLGYGSIALLVWALIRRSKKLAKFGFFSLLAFSLLRPVSPSMQMNPPQAVSAAAARERLGLGREGWPAAPETRPGTRYMLAQIAFIEGDRARAAHFSAGLAGRDLASPIEAPFRLQFLQGLPVGRTTVCYIQGCFPETVRRILQIAMALLVLASLALGGAAIRLRGLLRRRCERIEQLSGELIRRQRAAA